MRRVDIATAYSSRLSRLSLVAPLFLVVVGMGCNNLPGSSDPADNDPVQVLDGGRALNDGGDANSNPDSTPDSGITTAPNSDGGSQPNPPGADGGFALPDGGLVSYESTAEDGVRCGANLQACAVGDNCCAALDFTSFSLTGQCGVDDTGTAGSCSGNFVFACDDTANDCSGGNICCAHVVADINNFQFEATTVCSERATCIGGGDSEVCTTASDCPAQQECCGLAVSGVSFPVDMGVCQPSCSQ